MAWLDEALRANPRGAEAHNGRGEILWDHGRSEEALAEFDRAVEIESGYFPARLNQIEIYIEEFQDYGTALELSDRMLEESLDRSVEAEVYYLKAKSLFYLDDLEGALFLLRRAIKSNGEVGIYRGFEGQIFFELGQFVDARRSLERSLALEPECAHSLYHMGLVLEHMGEVERAEGLFAQAANLMPDLYPLPIRISEDEFESAAREALNGIPEEILRYIEGCPILIQDLPDPELVREEHLSPQILGLFEGVPATSPGAALSVQRTDMDRILLFKRNLEKVAATRAELIDQIRITVKHEVGHFLGMDEDEIERLGLA